MKRDVNHPDGLDNRIADALRLIEPPSSLDAGLHRRIRRVQRRRRATIGSVCGMLFMCCIGALVVLTQHDEAGTTLLAQEDADGQRHETKIASAPERNETEHRAAQIRFDQPRDYIVVQPKTKNPNITVFMIYKAESVAADAGDGRPQSSTIQQEPGA